ncbi:MAG: thiamine biosynthesis protein [Gammaproteobacteria bacterium]|nr:thiamine biosynthesis protein [Gammaproteobacteria bacterium]
MTSTHRRANILPSPRCKTARRALSCIFILTASFALNSVQGQEVSRHYENVLGTSMDITVYGPEQAASETAMDKVAEEIARLEQILSTYRDDSDLMQLNTSRSTDNAPQALIDVISACEEWLERSEGSFSCRLGEVIAFWDNAEEAQLVPDRRAANSVARMARDAELLIEGSSITLGEGLTLETSGLAKGYIIDRGMDLLRSELPGATAIKLDIGGDAVYWGSPPNASGWIVMIADPESGSDNDNFISSLTLASKAVATSGHNSRTRQILMREFSHILTPQSGWPVFNGLYAVVIADEALTADAIATAMTVMDSEAALGFVESLPDIEALIIDSSGSPVISSGWNEYLSEELQQLNNANFNLTLEYTIPEREEGEAVYERPYVAVWVSDTERIALKNLLLLGVEERWMGTNSRWWRRAGRRATLEQSNVTRPTRPPGEYTVTWDGRDDGGNLLPPGTYLLNVEASREHGGHNHRAIEFSMEEGTQVIEQDRFGEVGAFRVTVEMSLTE